MYIINSMMILQLPSSQGPLQGPTRVVIMVVVMAALQLLLLAKSSQAFLHSPAQQLEVAARTSTMSLMRPTTSTTPTKTALDAVVVVAGATGYIGRNVVRESVARKDVTIALVRSSDNSNNNSYLKGAELVECDVTDATSVRKAMVAIQNRHGGTIDNVVSCLASRSGFPQDTYNVDYQAAKNVLDASHHVAADHFCLLSAYCVRKPLLRFQHAKLKLEAELQSSVDNDSDDDTTFVSSSSSETESTVDSDSSKVLINANNNNAYNREQQKRKVQSYSIVRPTAFFKSVAGQFENIRAGKPIVLFGDGVSAPCNPIAEADLAEFLLDVRFMKPASTWNDEDGMKKNRIFDIGGAGPPVTHKKYNTMMHQAIRAAQSQTRLPESPNYIHVPIATFDVIIRVCEALARVTGPLIGQVMTAFAMLSSSSSRSSDTHATDVVTEALENAAEVTRIVRYYAVEPMLTTREEECYGNRQLADYYRDIAVNGQEYDPYVSIYSKQQLQNSISSSLVLEPVYNVTGTLY